MSFRGGTECGNRQRNNQWGREAMRDGHSGKYLKRRLEGEGYCHIAAPLPYSSTNRFLEVTIDNQLNWNTHINKLVLKLNRHAGVKYKIRYKIDPSVTLKLYDSMTLCHISFCSIFWAANCNVSKLHKLHLIQKRVLRLEAKRTTPSKPIFKKLHRLTIYDIYRLQLGSFIFSNINGHTLNLFPNQFQTNFQLHSRDTKKCSKLYVGFARTNLRMSSISIAGLKLCNIIPTNIQLSISLFIFKRCFKKWCLSAY